MALYAIEKFGKGGAMDEVSVYWPQDQYVHDATFIRKIEMGLGRTRGGIWSARVGSFRPSQSNYPIDAIPCDRLT